MKTPPSVDAEEHKNPFLIKKFSLSGSSKAMETQMLADHFVLDRIAIQGQATAIYAKPNTGKTLLVLWMLIESIKLGRINSKDVFYINADDTYKGLVFKTSLAERYGFEMISPGHNGFESAALQVYLKQMIDDGTAHGVIIILDTLKKFTDLMNKKTSSQFMVRAREFVSHGGTLIMLAHVNKNRGANGKCVFGGTSDISDDSDCVYILDEIERTSTTKQVLFENIKCRGDVAREVAFSYSGETGKSYQQLLDSVQMATQSQLFKAKIAKKQKNDKPAIDAINAAIENGYSLKTELVNTASHDSGISRRKIAKVLGDYTVAESSNDGLWRESVGDKNAKSYHLITTASTNC